MNPLNDVCKIGQGADCCKYILLGPKGFECAKTEGNKEMIDKVWNKFKAAQGDNCDGLTREELNTNGTG